MKFTGVFEKRAYAVGAGNNRLAQQQVQPAPIPFMEDPIGTYTGEGGLVKPHMETGTPVQASPRASADHLLELPGMGNPVIPQPAGDTPEAKADYEKIKRFQNGDSAAAQEQAATNQKAETLVRGNPVARKDTRAPWTQGNDWINENFIKRFNLPSWLNSGWAKALLGGGGLMGVAGLSRMMLPQLFQAPQKSWLQRLFGG